MVMYTLTCVCPECGLEQPYFQELSHHGGYRIPPHLKNLCVDCQRQLVFDDVKNKAEMEEVRRLHTEENGWWNGIDAAKVIRMDYCDLCGYYFETDGPIGTHCSRVFCPSCIKGEHSVEVRKMQCEDYRHWGWCTENMHTVENRPSRCGECQFEDVCPEKWYGMPAKTGESFMAAIADQTINRIASLIPQEIIDKRFADHANESEAPV